jgi:hypothetical protein
MGQYYSYIGNQRYDKVLLELAESFKNNPRDGRLSVSDVHTLFDAAQDGFRVTQVEIDTLFHIRREFNLTDAADRVFAERMNQIHT